MKSLNVLVVDPEPEIAEILSDEFISKGISTLCTSSLVEAREYLKKHRFDLITLDHRFPADCGDDLIPLAIKSSPEVWVITIHEDEPERLLKSGIHRIFYKPLFFQEFRTALDEWIVSLPRTVSANPK